MLYGPCLCCGAVAVEFLHEGFNYTSGNVRRWFQCQQCGAIITHEDEFDMDEPLVEVIFNPNDV